MNKKIIVKGILCCVLALSLFASSLIVGAEPDKKAAPLKDTGLKTVLDRLVHENSMTQEKADSIIKYIEQNIENQNEAKDQENSNTGHRKLFIFEELVKANVITAEEAELIRQKQRQILEEKINEELHALVQKGTLKEEDIVRIKDYLKKEHEQRVKDFEKARNMTPEEKKTYFEQLRQSRKPLLEKMVQDNIITIQQAKELRNVFPRAYHIKCRQH